MNTYYKEEKTITIVGVETKVYEVYNRLMVL